MTHRQDPSGRFIVTQRVFRGYRGTQLAHALVEFALTNQYLAFEHRGRDREERLAAVVAKSIFGRHQLTRLKKSRLFGARRLDVALCGIRDAARRAAKRPGKYHELRVIGLG